MSEKQKQPTVEELQAKIAELEDFIEVACPMLEYQPTIEGPPVPQKALFDRAASGDGITTETWKKQWIEQATENAKRYDVLNNTIMDVYLSNLGKPCIVAGSGPSLKKNAKQLKDRGFIGLVSCLHNFGYFVDNDIWPDYYLTLDAGDITIEEVYQGGKKHDQDYYWEQTKNCTLLAATVSNPKLIEKWQGKILWYGAIMPTEEMCNLHINAIGGQIASLSVGGNALGACMYFARAIMGSTPIAFVGADFCFSYRKKFHPFDSPYDQKFAGLVKMTDIYGNAVGSWPSYVGFKNWFDFIACGAFNGLPQLFVNCTEGGLLGAYPDGNIKQVIQMKLKQFIDMYRLPEKLLPAMKEHDGTTRPVILF